MPEDADGGLAQARRELHALAEAARQAAAEPPEGRGEAADGMVKVTARDGRISTVELNPKAMRMASQDLAEAVTKAANAALDDLATKFPAVAAGPTIDPARLDAELAEVEQQSIMAMRRYQQTIDDALRQLS
jgi:DNA-binding protein YbaB